MVGVLGLGLTVAVAAAQAPNAPRRGATLLAPQAIHPSELPTVARATPEEVPAQPAMTPVTRTLTKAPASGPDWLNGTDPNVRPAGGTAGSRQPVRPLVLPMGNAKDEPSYLSKGLDKLKGAFGSNDRTENQGRTPGNLPSGFAAGQPNANSPFRGTAANGAPVYAGPPAYRWYGWGSVTPGANPYAPTGQYPPASANWFSITGATPGAFPVPVMNPLRPPPGTEPPAYVTVPNRRIPPASSFTPVTVPTSRGSTPPLDPVAHVPPPADLSGVATAAPAARPVPTPTITPPPAIVVPAVTPVPTTAPLVTEKEPPLAPPLPVPETKPLAPAAGTTTVPAPLPVSVTEDPLDWQPRTGAPAGGEWTPAGGRPRTPATPPATTPQQPGASRNVQGHSVARGQAADVRPDPMVSLVRQMCDGRASGVDVRWTGSKKLSVSFECRTASDAQQLVKAISARPELGPLQIEFCATVK
jgi:hypothetical protein